MSKPHLGFAFKNIKVMAKMVPDTSMSLQLTTLQPAEFCQGPPNTFLHFPSRSPQ